MTPPDPRRYGDGTQHPLATLAQRGDASLAAAVTRALADARDADIGAAFAAAATQDGYRTLWTAVVAAIDAAPADASVVTRAFAMPLLLVCGTRAAATLPAVLKDVGAVVKAMEESGALGGSRNLGFSNALVDLDTLQAIAPSALRAWNVGGGARDLAPAPVRLAPGDETVHLRFLLGASVTPPHAPSIVETAANIGAWGMKATQVLSQQLASPGVDVLAMARPPQGIMKAAYAGRRAGLEAAFNLFLSNNLRRFRTKVGDASMIVSAHAGGELRVTLHTPLDEGLTEGYRWPLHPLDDIADIVQSMEAFARECRILDIMTVSEVLPDTTATGAVLFPTGPYGSARH